MNAARRRGSRLIVAGLALAWAALSQPAWADRPPVGVASPADGDASLAESLAKQAAAAEKRGDRRAAARWWLRAQRWDPTRVIDLRRAVDQLEKVDPPAAVRQAALLLDADPGFGVGDPSLLLRLRAAAVEIDTDESFAVAARLTKRLATWAEARPGLGDSRVADLWREAGEQDATAGDAASASDSFDRLQRMVIGEPDDGAVASRAVRWDLIADIHLEADQAERAAVAGGRRAVAHGDTLEVLRGRARVALRIGEPLAAVAHAKRAIEEAEPVWDTDPPYQELVAALRGINQPDRAVRTLSGYHEQRPDNGTLTLALIDALVEVGADRRAWELSEALLDRRLASAAAARNRDAIAVEGRALTEAATAYFRLGVLTGRRDAVVKRLPSLAASIDSIDAMIHVLDPLLADEGFRHRLAAWCDRHAGGLQSEELPAGTRRAASAVGMALGQYAVSATALRSRLEESIEAGADAAAIGEELDYWIDEAFARGAYAEAAKEIRWFLAAAEAAFDTEAEGVARRIALSRLDLAECLIETLPIDNRRAQGKEEALGLLAAAERVLSDDPVARASRVYLLYRLGATDEAIEAGARYLEEWPTPAASGVVDEYSHRAVTITLADALAGRGAAEDEERAVALYEDLLDRWPDDPQVLNALAYQWAAPGGPLARAERMARRAVEIDPGESDYVDTLGWVLFHQGRYTEAAATLAEAVELVQAGGDTSSLAILREHHAAALRRLGRAEEAEAADAR